jgi:hypothetical protein
MPGGRHFHRDNEVIAELDIPLRFLREGAEAKALDFFDGQPAYADDIEVEDGMFGHRVIAHFEDDRPVGAPRPFDFGAGDAPQLVGGPRVT